MSKISEQKALEAYSENWYRDCDGDSWDANEKLRKGYIKGYDQAMQAFSKKSCEWLIKGFDNLKPSIEAMTNIMMDCYQQGFKNCWKLLTGKDFDE